MELLILLLVPVLTVTPSFLVTAWLLHRLVPLRWQIPFGLFLYVAGLVLSVPLNGKDLLLLPIRGSLLGMALAPLLAVYWTKTCPPAAAAEPGPIGAAGGQVAFPPGGETAPFFGEA